MPATTFAHAVGGGALPAPPWLLSYIGVAGMLLTLVALRATWPTARLRRFALEAAGAEAPAPSRRGPTIGQLVGIALLGLVFAAALAGPTGLEDQAGNIAPVAVTVVWWVSLPILSLLLGDVMGVINPFVGIVATVEGLRPQREPAAPPPTWIPAVFLGAFAWYFPAYYRPGSPRALALFLAIYCLAAIGAGLRWGSEWLRTGEGFGALSAAIARFSPRGSRRRVEGTAALMVVWLGGVLFDRLSVTNFWAIDVLGTSRGWGRTALDTVGIVWMTAVAGAVVLTAFRVAARRAAPGADSDDDPADGRFGLVAALGIAFVPLATGWFIAHDFTLLLFEGQNFIALLSDPFGQGWDLFGTINRTPWYGWFGSSWLGWVQVLALTAGHVGAVVVGHDLAIRLVGRRRGMAATWAVSAVAAASLVAAALLVLK